MSESKISVTEGAGKNIQSWDRTVSSVLVQDQFVLPGAYPYPTYAAVTTTAVATTTTADHLLQIMAGASKHVRLTKVVVSQKAAAGSATATEIYLVRLTTAGTGGTSITPSKLDSADAAAGATAMALPTAKGTEGAFLWVEDIPLSATYGQGRWSWTVGAHSKPIIIPAGTSNGIAVRLGIGVATATVMVAAEFVETDYL